MDSLHFRNKEFVKNAKIYNHEFHLFQYYPIPQSLGDEYHRRLLNDYWEIYLTNTDNDFVAINRMESAYSSPSYSPGKIVPYIDAESCYGRDSDHSYTSAYLETLIRHFEAAVLTHYEWKQLTSQPQLESFAKLNKTNINESGRQLDLVLDYTDWLPNNKEYSNFTGCPYNWRTIENKLTKLDKPGQRPLEKVRLTTLLFSVAKTTGNFIVNVDTEFARRLSSRLVIGCAVQPNAFEAWSHSTASAVVASCKQVNGSLYTLQYRFKLESLKLDLQNIQHFENYVRPKLEQLKQTRHEILIQHPEATVYFQLRFELQIIDDHVTVFCNSEALFLNEYIEAIVNWASINGISFIMGRAFDNISQKRSPTWFSVLRPPSLFRSSKHLEPYLVIRNSPKILLDADVEPFVEWTMDKPSVSESYFHNTHVGLRFHANPIGSNKLISVEEHQILLRFILQRFDLVEVELDGVSYENFIIALNILAEKHGLVHPSKTILLYFETRKTVDHEKLQDFQSFVSFIKITLGNNISILKGISFLWDEFDEPDLRLGDFQSSLTRHNMTALAFDRNLNLNLGVVMGTSSCQEILSDLIERKLKPEFHSLHHRSEYLVCVDFVDLNTHNNPKILGALFDKHLYLKKLFKDFSTHIDLYFEVFVNFVTSATTMNDYLILLSHFQTFAATYNLSYIVVNAFDFEGKDPIGWWKISNNTDLTLTSVYEEKYSASVGFNTWRPTLHSDRATDATKNIIVATLVSGLVLMIVVLGVVLWYYKYRKPQYISNKEENEFYNGKEAAADDNTSDLDYLKFDKKFELSLADICIGILENYFIRDYKYPFSKDPKDLLGRGNFGTVYKGLVKDKPVAIKRPNENCGATSFKSVLCEIKVLCYVGTHSNVVMFIGAYTREIRKGILYIATELCTNGSVHEFLRANHRVIASYADGTDEIIGRVEDEFTVYSHDLHRFAKEIASGMDYIAGKKVIHGDLSARNVLLDENFTCKIGDFGLSRKLYEYLEYVKKSQEPLPWKWMAYESLKSMEFTSKSDMWSYGVTLWEIYSLGSVPYGGLAWTTGFVNDLKDGLRLQTPEYATEEIYKMMYDCWDLDADQRPTFIDMVDFFNQLISSQYITLQL